MYEEGLRAQFLTELIRIGVQPLEAIEFTKKMVEYVLKGE